MEIIIISKAVAMELNIHFPNSHSGVQRPQVSYMQMVID